MAPSASGKRRHCDSAAGRLRNDGLSCSSGVGARTAAATGTLREVVTAKGIIAPQFPSGYIPLQSVDWMIGGGLALLVLATRLPFRSQMLFNWDSANFALALQHYDVTQHRPHPPGYPLYVASGKLLNLAGLEANTALTLVAMLLSAIAVLVLYLLGRSIFGRAAGTVAALLLAFSVTFWWGGGVALAYTALALFSSLVALYSYRTLVQRCDHSIPAALAYSLGAGFRPDLLLLLGPLWLAGLGGLPRHKQLNSLALAAAGVLLWLVPTALLSGGFGPYLAVLGAYFGVDVVEKYSSTQSGTAGLLRNLRDTAAYLFYALYAAALPLGIALVWWLARWTNAVSGLGLCLRTRLDHIGEGLPPCEGRDYTVFPSPSRWGGLALLLAAWILPILAFYTVVHIGDPGYIFSLLPAVLLLAARPLGAWLEEGAGSGRARAVATILAAVLVANVGIFLFRPGSLTWPGIRANDTSLSKRIEHIRSTYDPAEVHLLSYSTYKHLHYYLPAYWHSQWVDVYLPPPQEVVVPAGVHWLLVVDPEVTVQQAPAEAIQERVELGGGVSIARWPVQPGQAAIVGGPY